MTSESEEYQKLLAQLASLKGIETEYQDVWGNLHSLSPAITLRILSAMGCQVGNADQLEKEIQAIENQGWGPVTQSVLILSLNALPAEILFQIPSAPVGQPEGLPLGLQAQLVIKEESGKVETRYFSPEELFYRGTARIGEAFYQRGGLPFPREIPLGRHHLVLTLKQDQQCLEQTVQVIVCPEKTYLPPALEGGGKRAGLMVSLAGLRSNINWGVGDFRDLKELTSWVIEVLQADVVGLLPLHAVANREPYNISPYYPSSRLYRNPIYLSIPEIEEYSLSLTAKEMVESPEIRRSLSELRESEKVQFQEVYQLKKKDFKNNFPNFFRLLLETDRRGNPTSKGIPDIS